MACRPSLPAEIAQVDELLRGYLRAFAAELLSLPRFDEMASGHVGDLADRAIAALEEVASL
jgi:hypothetical protein